MKALGNVLWNFPFFGFINATMVYLLGLLLTVIVVGTPLGVGLMECGKFLFAPFGRRMDVDENKAHITTLPHLIGMCGTGIGAIWGLVYAFEHSYSLSGYIFFYFVGSLAGTAIGCICASLLFLGAALYFIVSCLRTCDAG